MREIYHRCIDLPKEVTLLSSLFATGGRQLYLVGGAVRDALLGQQPKDLDLATDALPDDVIGLLSNVLGVKVLDVGKAFGVVKAIFPSGTEVEIATFRTDVGKGRRPESVVFSTIEEDVKRRDLTINALFYDISRNEIVDMVGGVTDLTNRVIKTVGSPVERFDEDRLRILRAIRFAAQFGCELDPETELAINGLSYPRLKGVSSERIREEFLKGVKKAHSVVQFAVMLDRLNMWREILPDVSINILEAREIKDDPLLFMALLVEGSSGEIEDSMKQMKYSSDEVLKVVFLLSFRWLSAGDIRYAQQLHGTFRRLKSNHLIDETTVRKFSGFKHLPMKSAINAFFDYNPTVSGQQLIDEGFKGKELGIELARREAIRFTQVFDAQEKETSTIT